MSNSSEPKIRGLKSLRLIMEPGKYMYCACGRSNNNPFCDGSHIEETDIKPIPVTIKFKYEVRWCDCRKSKKLPFCDHSHRELPSYKPK
ncbi:MAG: CDGSH iron-sulfur domain-containing protein [Bacteroidales bacterium]|jgi:CDGSH-type Zn-finger protein|nr:CDGSH iron-sulfur domain-containing protein [Bacteroidales bacterium]